MLSRLPSPAFWPCKGKWDADRAVREQKSWDDSTGRQKDAFDKQKAEELAATHTGADRGTGSYGQRNGLSVTPK